MLDQYLEAALLIVETMLINLLKIRSIVQHKNINKITIL